MGNRMQIWRCIRRSISKCTILDQIRLFHGISDAPAAFDIVVFVLYIDTQGTNLYSNGSLEHIPFDDLKIFFIRLAKNHQYVVPPIRSCSDCQH